MPDIDIDFSVKGRDRVMRYVADKYGRDCVAQIVTFGRMFPRAATRDAARVLDFDYGTGDRLAKLIPDPIMGRPPSFEDCLKPGEELAQARWPRTRTPSRSSTSRRASRASCATPSIHAAAVVIAAGAAHGHRAAPARRGPGKVDENGNKLLRTVTQYSMKPIEEIGLLKMDFLGLRNLDVIESALDIIEHSTGERPDMATLPLDDPKTYEMLAARRLDRRVPVRVRRHARGAAEGQADRVRGPRRARRALPPGRHAPHRHLRAQQAPARRASPTSTSACARSPSPPTR